MVDKFMELSEEKRMSIINASIKCFEFGYEKASIVILRQPQIFQSVYVSVFWQ